LRAKAKQSRRRHRLDCFVAYAPRKDGSNDAASPNNCTALCQKIFDRREPGLFIPRFKGIGQGTLAWITFLYPEDGAMTVVKNDKDIDPLASFENLNIPL
jgi:hypothetical protein